MNSDLVIEKLSRTHYLLGFQEATRQISNRIEIVGLALDLTPYTQRLLVKIIREVGEEEIANGEKRY